MAPSPVARHGGGSYGSGAVRERGVPAGRPGRRRRVSRGAAARRRRALPPRRGGARAPGVTRPGWARTGRPRRTRPTLTGRDYPDPPVPGSGGPGLSRAPPGRVRTRLIPRDRVLTRPAPRDRRLPRGLVPVRCWRVRPGLVQPGAVRFCLGAEPVRSSNPGAGDPGTEYPAAVPRYRVPPIPGPNIRPGRPEPGALLRHGVSGPRLSRSEDYSASRARVAWGRDPADEPGEGDW